MGNFTKKSKIDFIRIRRHGATSKFRFLKDGQTGYVKIAELTKDFVVSRKWDSQIGARVERLVFDAPDGFDYAAIVKDAAFGDLLNGDGRVLRYSITAETEPTANENRFRFLVTAAFNDTTPIVVV